MIGDCEICGRHAIDLCPTPSLLDGYDYDICQTCSDYHAQDWRAVANFLRSSSWQKLDPAIKAAIRFWQDEGYVEADAAMRALIERQVVPVEPAGPTNAPNSDEDDRLLASIMEHMAEADPKEELPPEPTPDRDWISRAMSWFFPILFRGAAA